MSASKVPIAVASVVIDLIRGRVEVMLLLMMPVPVPEGVALGSDMVTEIADGMI